MKLHLTRASSRQRCPPTCPRTNPQPFDSSSQTSQRASPSIVPRYNNCRNSFPATPSKACPRPPTNPPAHPCPQTSSPSSSRSAATSSSQPIESAKVLLSLLFSPPSQSPAITGHAQQWGSVKTKKDKKPPTPSPKDHPASRDRTDSHGGRGGRGRGRGGPTRGARGRGSPRAGPGVNGHASRSPHPGKTSSPAPDSADRQPVEDFSDPVQPDKHDSSDGILSAPNDSPSDPNHTAGLPASDPSIPAQSWSTPSSWGASPWGAQDHSASAPPTSSQPISAAQRPTKLPATSKLSWAQIARSEISVLLYPPFPSSYMLNRPQEKPAAVPPPPVAPRVPPSAPEQAEPSPAPLTNGDSDPIGDGWEDPITVQPPTWDDEPQVKPPPEDAWSSPVQTEEDVQDETPAFLSEEEPLPEIPASVPSEPAPVPQQPAEEPAAAPAPSKSPVPPRSSAASHRSVNRYKATDQAVVMPTSGFNLGLEKVGMQFGSLSLGGDIIEPSP